MAGAGKSFIGRNLAKKLDFLFIDTDDLIEEQQGVTLQTLLDKHGDNKFVEIETKAITDLNDIQNMIISPGGSVCYSSQAMDFLKNNSVVIYLADSYDHIFGRVKNLETRGIVGLKEKSFEQLFTEREKLYKKYADIIINMSEMQTADKFQKAEQVIEQIKTALLTITPK